MADRETLQRLEQLRLYETERRRAEELAAINLVVTVANETPQLGRMLDRILRAVVAVMDMEAGGIYLLDEGTNALLLKSWLGVDEGFVKAVDHLPVGESLAGRAFSSGKTIVSEEISWDGRLSRELLRKVNLHAGAFVPLGAKGKKLGVMWTASRQKCLIPSEDVRLLETMARQIALAIENALLLEEAKRRAEEMALLNEVSLAITSVLDIEQVLTLIMSKAREMVGAEAGSVLLLDEESGELVFSTCVGEKNELLRGRRLPLGRGVAGWVVQRGEAALVVDVAQDERFYKGMDEATGFHTRSLICAPLKVRGKVIGALEMVNKVEGDFSADGLRLLNALALPAAIAIENARLYETTRRQNEQLSALLEANTRLLEETEKALRQVAKSEERYRNLMERAGDAIFVLDAQGDYLEANPSACQLLGHSREELLNLNVRDVLAGDAKEEFLRWLADPGEQKCYDRELQQVHKDGSLIWTGLRAVPLGDGTYQAIGRDIRDRKALEKEREEYALRLAQEVKERTAELSALFQVARVLTSTLNLEEILAFIVSQASELLGVPHSHVFFYDPEREEMVGQASHGWEGAIRGVRIPLAESPLLQEVYHQGRPLAVNDRAETQPDPLRDLLRAKVALAAPMLMRGKVGGLLLFVADKPRPFRAEEIRLAANLANLAGMALENARLYEEAREKAEQIAEEKRQIDGILNSTADGLIVLDNAARLLLANPVAAHMLGFDLKEALGEQIGGEKLNNPLWLSLLDLSQRYVPEASVVWEIPDFHHLNPAICWQEKDCTRKDCPLYGTIGRYCWLESDVPPGNSAIPALDETLSRRQAKSFCLSCPLFQDLPKLYIEAKATPLKDEGGKVTGTVITMRDITELKELEHLKSQFVSNVSHELRTPLSVIKLHADNFLRYYERLDDERRMEMVRTIKARADSLHNLIEDVLNLARLDAGREPKIEPFDLTALCREIVAEMENIAQTKGLALESTFPPEPVIIEADRELLSQVVRNLLSNALKFTSEGGEVSLSLSLEEAEGFVQISVRDTGIGIPPEEQERVFERFYRAREAVERGIPGTGLGLSIVAEIVREHSGEISLESQPGQGSTFTVLLPWKGRKKLILAVDDDTSLLRLYGSILSNAGYEVHTAASGPQALAWLEEGAPDLILLDMVMPEMDGCQVLTKLKENPRTRDIPVMVMTAYDVDPQKLQELEIADFLTKPFSIPVLLDSVRRLLRTHRR